MDLSRPVPFFTFLPSGYDRKIPHRYETRCGFVNAFHGINGHGHRAVVTVRAFELDL